MPGVVAPSLAAAGLKPADIDPARVSPALAALIGERESLQAGVAALAGGSAADSRFAVARMADRRAEFARWSATRDAVRARPRPPAPVAVAPGQSNSPATAPLPLRPTPGETVPAGNVPLDPRGWLAARDAATTTDDGRRAAAPPPGDALDRRLARARDMIARARTPATAANRALDAARDAIPANWTERARERIPGLGRADPYVRETARKLAVAVGTIAELTDKADEMHALASNVRELRDADTANDDARRDRALDRLRARRAEEG